jgi:ATP-dependent Zn protease
LKKSERLSIDAQVLDTALTRPGRFDRQITVDRPDMQVQFQSLNPTLSHEP